MTVISDLKFPILRCNQFHLACLDEKRVLTENELWLKNGAYIAGTEFIDSSGNLYEILSTQKRRRSYSWMYFGAKNTTWVIDFELNFVGTLSLGEVKDKALSLIMKKKWYVQADCSGEVFKKEMLAKDSCEEVYRMISFLEKLQ